MVKRISIDEEFITLGQFLKHISVVSTGGQAKWYLQEHTVLVDGVEENRRGKKLFSGSSVEILSEGLFIIDSRFCKDESLTDEN